tara:strand:- start:713 stop:907 length:195 start_codon:yes stop_codon:yes gene_type:complete
MRLLSTSNNALALAKAMVTPETKTVTLPVVVPKTKIIKQKTTQTQQTILKDLTPICPQPLLLNQ